MGAVIDHRERRLRPPRTSVGLSAGVTGMSPDLDDFEDMTPSRV
jgi:hypothetical protein